MTVAKPPDEAGSRVVTADVPSKVAPEKMLVGVV